MYNKSGIKKLGMKMKKEDKKQIGFFITQETKVKLQKLSMNNNRTLSGELTELIESAFDKMEKNNGKK